MSDPINQIDLSNNILSLLNPGHSVKRDINQYNEELKKHGLRL